jgi:hypothetical protein
MLALLLIAYGLLLAKSFQLILPISTNAFQAR